MVHSSAHECSKSINLKELNLFADPFCREGVVKRSWKRRSDFERKLKNLFSQKKKI